MIDSGLEDASLTLGSGEERAGKDLRDIIEQARASCGIIDGLHSRYDRFVVEQAAIGGAFDPSDLRRSECGDREGRR